MRWTVVPRCTDLWRRGGVGATATGCPHRRARSSRASISLCRNYRRSEMLDLRRFPVSDEFISDRKTFCTILYRNVFFDFTFFKFPRTLKKGAVMAKTEISALQRAFSTGSRSRRNPKVLPFDAQGDFRHFHVFGGHVITYAKPIIGNFKNFIHVKYHTKRAPVCLFSVRHREPPQNAHL